MKNLYNEEINKHRIRISKHIGDEGCGAFVVPYNNKIFRCIISGYYGWEHLSISLINVDRTPTWSEMCYFKDFFFNEDECLVQYHPAKKDCVNIHPYVLHMWRPLGENIKMPPKYMV